MGEGALGVRLFAESDLPGVLDLLRASLGESVSLQRTPDLFAWKHLDNPFGRSVMLVATDGQTIAGFRAFMRWELDLPGGGRLRCVRAVDTATHPDYRRRGIFRNLTMAAVEAAADDDVDLIFNTPNPRSGAGYLSMGWSEVGAIRPMASPARGLLRRAPDVAQLPDPTDFVSEIGAMTSLQDVDREARGLRTPRTAAYRTWRFTGHPSARYVQIAGKHGAAVARLAYRGRQRELLISDLYGEKMHQTIRHCRSVARTSYIGAFFSKGSPERRAALRAGLVPVPRAGLTLMARPLRPIPVDVADLNSWDIALSDLELL